MKRNFALVFAICSLLLPSCVVYMPMQCAAPQITDKKQGEVSGSSYLNGRVEVAGTYSPVRHLLVRAAYSSRHGNPQDSTYYRGYQYDLGLGTYWPLGKQWLVGGLGGFGQAQGAAAYTRTGFLFGYPTRYEFDTRYNKWFGEAYGIFQATSVVSFGAAYRVTQVDFTRLTNLGAPVDLGRMTRSEPMLFLRVRLGHGPLEDRPVQLQAAWGVSNTFGYPPPQGSNVVYGPGVSDLKQGRSYSTIGISIFPHCFFHKGTSGGEGR